MNMIDRGRAIAHDLRVWALRQRSDLLSRYWFLRFLFGRESAYSMHLRIKREGYDAFMRGDTLDMNPYPNKRALDELPHGAWTKGWREGEAVITHSRQIQAPRAAITRSSRKGDR
ncbi:ribosome modulation factor [Burkholderia diffusa]|uniref:ribosome modulation factor n=1 Tax=Burkholderia diffusa TaxID=488732 RepID=UPI00076D2A14|nr:hypothetical protein [Burkholderia diffusa]KVC20409.1 hypothetical protein WI69_09045 [Burkholderia diffusa]KVG31032.1 hypothetical protein WJ30_17620 [Burkholderia diffusa]